jgi:hypothetical protein
MKINFDFIGRFLALAMIAASFCMLTSCKSTKFDFPPAEGKKLYISQNFWFEKPEKIYAINYKKGNLIPAGTEVSAVQFSDDEIFFFVPSMGLNFRIVYRDKYQGSMPIRSFVDRLFTSKNLDELTKGFTKKEKEFVKSGILRTGISKNAVLVGYGYPPAHRTPSLETTRWIYWTSKFAKQELIFDSKGMLVGFR